jgi:transposase
MTVLYERCCGIDVHKAMLVACVICQRDGQISKQIRQFSTLTPALLELSDWLTSLGVTHVAMESTGVYWKPVYNILEGAFTLLIVNAQHMKAVPGRKTDVRDAEWIADLLRHGLIQGSFVPDLLTRQLRDLTRLRTSLVADRTRLLNRVQKVLEDANIKLTTVVSDIRGVSATAMLKQMIDGQSDPQALVELARGRMKNRHQELLPALTGRLSDHHRFLLDELLKQIESLEGAIERISAEVALRMRPFEAEIALLDTIPGINRRGAETILAEIGLDMGRFPTAQHLASWAGICPGNDESAGKRRTGKTRRGSRWLRHALVEAAHGAARTKESYLQAQYRRLAPRRGKSKAVIAVGHSILVIVYHVLTRRTPYQELGGNYFDERAQTAVTRSCVLRLQKLGYDVELRPVKHAA